MQLELTERESQVLWQLLRDYLPSLEREAARTEDHDLRHGLVERQNLIEHLLERLGTPK